ncbi:MAG: carboxypeptidase-like regulatory domain-containing protein, partial [Candidatus Jordarchaeales archaeon]
KAYIKSNSYGGKIFECYNTFYYEGNWSQAPFHNNPKFTSGKNDRFRWTIDGAPFYGPNIISGPLFVAVTACANYTRHGPGGDQITTNYVNVTYRFFEWGWICETTTFFTESRDLNYYESCGYSFDPQIMQKLVYEGSEPLNMSVGSTYYLGTVSWFCTWGETLGVAAGIVDVAPLQYNITSPSLLWQFVAIYGSDSERWYRTTASLTVSSGNWIREHYAFYIWNGSQGHTPFVSFAEALRRKSVNVGWVEERFFNLTVHVRDMNGQALSGALIEIRNNDGVLLVCNTTNLDGFTSFYLYEGSYNICVSWNETHEGTPYQTYTNSTIVDLNENADIDVMLGIVNLICRVIYPWNSSIPYINVTVENGSQLVTSGLTDSMGQIHFRLPPGTYNIYLYEDGEQREVNDLNYVTLELSESNTPYSAILNCTYYLQLPSLNRTSIFVANGTSLSFTWTPYEVTLMVKWRYNETDVDRSEDESRYLQYRVMNASGVVLDWTNLTQHYGDDGIYYLANLTGLLYGGVGYTVEFRAGGSGFESVAASALVQVNPVMLSYSNVNVSRLGIYLWNQEDIPVWVRVYDDYNGLPVVGANVTWSVEGFGSFQLNHAGDGNYTGIIPKDLLPQGSYIVTFRVECANYTIYTKDRPIVIAPRPISLEFKPTYDVVFGDSVTFYVYCKDNLTGEPLRSVASVFYSIEGTMFFGVLTDEDGDGNYTGTFDTSLLPSGVSYSITVTVKLENYVSVEKTIYLFVKPVPMSIQNVQVSETRWRDTLNLTVTVWDMHNDVPVVDANVSCVIKKDGVVVFEAQLESLGGGVYALSIDTTNMLPGKYTVVFSASKEDYSAQPMQVEFSILPVPMRIQNVQVPETRWREKLNLTVTVWDTHNGVPVEDAVVSCVIMKDGVVVREIQLESLGGGTYRISIDTTSMSAGRYTAVLKASKENYLAQPMQVEFSILPASAAVAPVGNVALGGATPYLVLLGGYGEVENSVPFVVLVFEYKDAYGNPVPGATVTANGVPLTYIGDGRYILVVPTSAPSTIPIVVSASAENYESSQAFQVLNVKERSVAIPGINVRIPLTMFLIVSLAVIAPPASLAGYVYVKRMRIPLIIRRIDSLIEAIEKGAKVEVKKPLSRDDVILSLLWEEMAIVGVEPRVAAMPVEVVDKLVPLLVESGLSSEGAVTVLKELRASAPADRERLLASIGVPPDISAAILSELEKQEEKEEAKKAEELEEEEAEEKSGEKAEEEEGEKYRDDVKKKKGRRKK